MEPIVQHEILATDWVDPKPEKPQQQPAILPLVQFGFQTLGNLLPGLAGKVAYRLFATPRLRARHKVSDPVLERARIFEFMYAKQLLKGYEWGEGDRTILMVHGWESRGTALRSFVPGLVEKGFRVIAFDGPAHGDSPGHRTNLPHFAGAVQAIINQVGPVYGLIAHSFGGAATGYALSVLNPAIKVHRLVQIATPSNIEHIFQDAVQTMGLPKRVARKFRHILEGKIGGRKLAEINMVSAFATMQVEEGLLVHDREDRVVPYSSALDLATKVEHLQLLETRGYGHFRLVKNPDLIRAVQQFIAS